MPEIEMLPAARPRGRPRTVKPDESSYGQRGPDVQRLPKVQMQMDVASGKATLIGAAPAPKVVNHTPSAPEPPAPSHIKVTSKTHSAPTLIGLRIPMIVEIVAPVASEGEAVYDPKGNKVDLVNLHGNKFWGKLIGADHAANILVGLRGITDEGIAAAAQACDFLEGKPSVPPLVGRLDKPRGV